MMKEYKIADGDREIPVHIIYSDRRTMGLEIRPEGEVLARMPRRIPDMEVRKFIEKHRRWILKKLEARDGKEKAGETTGAKPVSSLTAGEIERIKTKIAERVVYHAERMGVTFGRITIRNQKTRWGSCSSKGNLNFNYQFYYLPDELLDYVVVHELAHRKHMDHSKAFWQEVERWYPKYREARARLRGIQLEHT